MVIVEMDSWMVGRPGKKSPIHHRPEAENWCLLPVVMVLQTSFGQGGPVRHRLEVENWFLGPVVIVPPGNL